LTPNQNENESKAGCKNVENSLDFNEEKARI
jgi:hypothetical protein